jgi:hypothetical protein
MTEKQKAASRANGAKSRGPKTEAGRQRSPQNAAKHGLCAGLVLLTNESEERFQNHRAAYLDRFQPADPVETGLVDQMVSAAWRLHRAWIAETTAIEREMVRITPELEAKYEGLKQESRLCVAMQNPMEKPHFLGTLGRHESRIVRLYHRALQSIPKLRELEKTPAASGSPNTTHSAPPPQGNEIPQNEPEPTVARTLTDAISSTCSLPLPPPQNKISQNEPEPAEKKTETDPVSSGCLPPTQNKISRNEPKPAGARRKKYGDAAPMNPRTLMRKVRTHDRHAIATASPLSKAIRPNYQCVFRRDRTTAGPLASQ